MNSYPLGDPPVTVPEDIFRKGIADAFRVARADGADAATLLDFVIFIVADASRPLMARREEVCAAYGERVPSLLLFLGDHPRELVVPIVIDNEIVELRTFDADEVTSAFAAAGN